MKFTLSWLKRHLETDAPLGKICEKLTAIGLEVESVDDPGMLYAPFKVALVEDAAPHPDADKLRVLQVKTAEGPKLQVVCGAPNARAGMKGIFAPEGTYIPGLDVTLKKTAIRGVESNGMMVSEREMCLSEEHNGIIEVDAHYEIGTPMAQIFGLDDPVIEINLTPNRPDCAGVYGIARDLAAAGLGKLRSLDCAAMPGSFPTPVGVQIEDQDGCKLFLGRSIRGVKNGPSPQWLQKLLKSVGLKPISALVDITNLMTLDVCRPLHVFDADKIAGDLVLRGAVPDERFEALDGETYALQPHMTAICDDNGVISLAGIMGGERTKCDEGTQNVFLEAAYFNPARIARTGRDLQISSDARYRFERGVDPAFTLAGIEMATRLILELCGGEAGEIVQAGETPQWEREITLDPAYTAQLTGVDVPAAEQKAILESLGFAVNGASPFTVQPPAWRGDVEGKADLAEEIIRIYGFEKIPSLSVHSETALPSPAETSLLARGRKARAALGARGLNESITWSFIGETQARHFGANDNQIAALRLKNPISLEMDVMRPSILPNLIEAAMRNNARGYPSAALCEIGPVYAGTKPEDQAIVATGIRAGEHGPRNWADANAARSVDLYDAKADALAALAACGAPIDNLQISRDAPSYYHPGRSGALRLGPNVMGFFGEIHPGILEETGVKFPVVGFEVFLQNIPAPRKKTGTEKPFLHLEPLQPLSRDFAFLVKEEVEAAAIIRAAMGADKALIRSADVFDIYTGKGIEPGKKSVALSVTLQPVEKSLTDKDIESLAQKVIESVCAKTGGTLRQ
ncbi:MAG: phenylalanine--tRNA ligase subunit beta [Alphaproteobacteria bacterium]|nr:phenylalanine--tRNA ligase subunit beta [Alphaproteobacteria bacterium]